MIYRRIRDLREDSDTTQAELGKELNVSQRCYSHFENGTRSIPLDILIKLADHYNVSVDYLLERTDNRKINR